MLVAVAQSGGLPLDDHLTGLRGIDLDGLVTKTYTLDGVNDGYDDMRSGKNIRGVIFYN